MDQEVLNKLEENLHKRYKSLRDGIMFIENYEGIIVLNWSVGNDLNINSHKVKQIITYINNFLKKHNQEGFFYTADRCFKVN